MSTPTAQQREQIRRLAVGRATDVNTLADGDIDELFDDGTVGGGDVLLTAIACAEMLAASAAQHFKWAADGASLSMADRQAQYLRTAAELRSRHANVGSTTLALATVVDDDESEFE